MKLLLSFLLILVSCQTFSQDKKLTVGVTNAPPFIIVDDYGITGVSVELWDMIASELKVEYELKQYGFSELLTKIENNEVDLSINPLTVTAGRLKRFSFTQPFYVTNLAIATKSKNSSTIVEYARKILSVEFLKVVLMLFLAIFIFGIIVWLIERKKNPKQFSKGAKGIGDGLWWSAVTMTSVGYGDKAPRTPMGRIVSILWMLMAVIVISSFTAGIASSLTIKQLESNIKNIDDLKRVKVGTMTATSSAEFLTEYHIMYTGYNNIIDGLEAIRNDEISAFVFDEAILDYMIHTEGYNDEIIIIPSSYSKEYFSFAAKDQVLINRINPILVQEIDKDSFARTLNRYHLED